MRKIKFANNEYYHIYNRGVDKRQIFSSQYDLSRFFQGMSEFNTLDPIGSLYENSFQKKGNTQLGSLASKSKKSDKLVGFTAFCLNPNHFHFILEQLEENGIEKFMHRLSTGYTKYFNQKHKRSGSLFQGTYQAVHIDSNEYLLHLSVYVNLNFRVHKIENHLFMSSWREYQKKSRFNFCDKDAVLGQFKNRDEYKRYVKMTLPGISERKDYLKELELGS
jgi:putative transposase